MGGPGFEDLLSIFLAGIKMSPVAPFFEHFLGCHLTKIFLSGHFAQENSPAAPFNVYF
jgi:hypothetical protein